MPSVFQLRFRSNGFPQLLNQFGEDAVFENGKPASKAVRVIVNRNPPAVYEESGTAYLNDFVLECLNSADGILVSEINRGVSTITLDKQTMISGTVTLTIVEIETQDNGVLQLRAR